MKVHYSTATAQKIVLPSHYNNDDKIHERSDGTVSAQNDRTRTALPHGGHHPRNATTV